MAPMSTSPLPTPASLCTLPPTSPCKLHRPSFTPPAATPFDNLVSALTRTLSTSPCTDPSSIPVADLISLMRSYTSTESEWSSFAFKDLTRNYTRNFVDHGNGKGNLLILVWSPGKGSLVHDHAGAHCVMKVLKGRLRETLYEMPADVGRPLDVRRTAVYERDQVAYISDDIGLHKIENADSEDVAVSLHLYTPPWAEKRGCYCFDENTGKKTKVEMCNYYSVHGQVRKPAYVQSCKD